MITGSLDPIYNALDRMANLDQYVAPAAAEVQKQLRATASAGQSPDGKPWAPTKDGRQPMKNAAAAITARAAGRNVIVELTGAEVFHHHGVRGAPARPVIPTDRIGETLGQAIRRGVVKPFRKRGQE